MLTLEKLGPPTAIGHPPTTLVIIQLLQLHPVPRCTRNKYNYNTLFEI